MSGTPIFSSFLFMRRLLSLSGLALTATLSLRAAVITQGPRVVAAAAPGYPRATCTTATAAVAAPTVAERVNEIVAPPLDTRTYRWVHLTNGLEAVLIHDAEAETSAAALEVKDAGHFSDPTDLPGLAHFVEHMCFLGTELEPDEGAYKAYLQRHGGSSNAFTGMEATGFHFSVGHAALPGALKRFAAFFTCSLMRESSCEREMNAIDSEFKRNLQSDLRRLFQLTKSTSSPDHPFSKFSTGNLQTLSASPQPHKAVMDFYRTHYVAGKMHLAIVGRESIDELEALVVASFANLRESPVIETPTEEPSPTANGDANGHAANGHAANGHDNVQSANGQAANGQAANGQAANGHAKGHANGHANGAAAPGFPHGGPFAPTQRGALLRATPVRETRMLRLMWELPPERHFLQSRALRLLSSLGGQEGEGSLTWLLTQRLDPPLATSVTCSSLYSLSDGQWRVTPSLRILLHCC